LVSIESPDSQELAAEDRLIDSKTVEAEYAEQVTELTRHGQKLERFFGKKTWNRE